MLNAKDAKIDYEGPVEISEGIYWIGFYDPRTGLHCNPYLIVDNEEALVIDGGSRPDFATVMMKILQTGIVPHQINALLYQHYDPDLCGSIPNFEGIIKNEDLKILSALKNLMFISHYSVSSPLFAIEKINNEFEFASGRRLEFISTPYCHSLGSFVTFDTKSKILFTSDLFGSYGTEWELFLKLKPQCIDCVNLAACPEGRKNCPINDIVNFHKQIMPSGKALKHALGKILDVPFSTIAPQHGSVITDREIMRYVFEVLISEANIGIDGIVKDERVINPGDLKERFK